MQSVRKQQFFIIHKVGFVLLALLNHLGGFLQLLGNHKFAKKQDDKLNLAT